MRGRLCLRGLHGNLNIVAGASRETRGRKGTQGGINFTALFKYVLGLTQKKQHGGPRSNVGVRCAWRVLDDREALEEPRSRRQRLQPAVRDARLSQSVHRLGLLLREQRCRRQAA